MPNPKLVSSQPACPNCQFTQTRVISTLPDYRRYHCDRCNHRFNVEKTSVGDLRRHNGKRTKEVKRSQSVSVQARLESQIDLSSSNSDNSLSRIDNSQPALRQKILNSFRFRPEQLALEIHQQTRGDFDDFHEALQQLEGEGEIVCVNVRPRRYRLVKAFYSLPNR